MDSPQYVWTGPINPGTYYWSVRSKRIVSQSQTIGSSTVITGFAAMRSFSVCGPDVAPSTPTLISPSNGQQIQTSNYNTNGAVSVTLQWNIPSFGSSCYGGTPQTIITYSKNADVSFFPFLFDFLFLFRLFLLFVCFLLFSNFFSFSLFFFWNSFQTL